MQPTLTIAFDADDTLWHNEGGFAEVEQLFNELLAPWADAEAAETALITNERARVSTYGYGVKSFALSMIATACELSNDEIPAATLRKFIDAADRLLAMPTVLLDGVAEVMAEVSAIHPTMVLTKGDLHHQLRRIDEADVARFCFDVEVVAEKNPATYRRILSRHSIDPARFVMIGNSVVSDVAPVVDIGGNAIHIPYETTWALETAAEDPPQTDRWTRVDSITEVPRIIESIAAELGERS